MSYEAIKEVASIMIGAIKDAGPQGFPSGHLYAAMMGYMNIDQYNAFIGAFIEKGWIRKSNHVLYFQAGEPPT